jgi:acetyltransferase-like isoleucine patch superfamily enzyme
MKIEYSNMPKGSSKIAFKLKYIMNVLRTWYVFNIKFPWIKYNGFVRVMKHTRFAKRDIIIGHNVQFGKHCSVAADVHFGNYILIASRVSFIGRNDHSFDNPGAYIWNGKRGQDDITRVEDDVWIGNGCNIIAGVTIGKGSIVAAGALVNKSIPPCEIWGGIPAKKIRNRFNSEEEKIKHIAFLNQKK